MSKLQRFSVAISLLVLFVMFIILAILSFNHGYKTTVGLSSRAGLAITILLIVLTYYLAEREEEVYVVEHIDTPEVELVSLKDPKHRIIGYSKHFTPGEKVKANEIAVFPIDYGSNTYIETAFKRKQSKDIVQLITKQPELN